MSFQGLKGSLVCFRRIVGLCIICCVAGFAFADDGVLVEKGAVLEKHAKLRALKASIRESIGSQSSVAGYLSIENSGAEDEVLVAVKSDAFERIEIHEHTNIDGMMRMRPVARVVVPAGAVVDFKPRGLHLMMFLTNPMVVGEHKKLQLYFASGTVVSVDAEVVPINSADY